MYPGKYYRLLPVLSGSSVVAESVAIVVEVDALDESAEGALVSSEVIFSAFFEQAVVRAIMAMKKKAVFVNAFIVLGVFCLSETDRTMSIYLLGNRKDNLTVFIFSRTTLGALPIVVID